MAVVLSSGAASWWTLAGASSNYVEYSAFEQISKSYAIPVTNPSDGATWPSVLLVASATLDTDQPGDRAIHAPPDEIYLSLQMSSGPVSRQVNDPNWGSYFSTMTPLPASAFSYLTPSGRRYPVTRTDPANQTYNANANNDGLVDATYYFTVPITNRSGTVVISPSRTVGTEFVGFTGGNPTQLNVGGPTRIAVSFPKTLTAAATRSSADSSASAAPYISFATAMNWLGLIFAGLVGLIIYARVRRRERRVPPPYARTSDSPPPSTAGTGAVAPRPTRPPRTDPTPPVPPVAPTAPVAPSSTASSITQVIPPPSPSILRVDVLGPLTITPSLAGASDPVRAILAYLALNNDRMATLEEIQNAVWPLTENGTDIKRPAMRNYMSDARKVVGEHHLPSASGRAGYQLIDVDTDWAEMKRLLTRARGAAKDERLILRQQALALSRGLPFSADTTRYFTWAFSTSVVFSIVETTTALTHSVATDLVLAGDLTGAREALAQGLLVDPASLTLWEDLTDVLLETPDQSLLALHWRAAELVLRPEDVTLLRSRENG